MRPKTLLKWTGGILLALVVLIYVGDWAWFTYRNWKPKAKDPLETMTFFLATATKGGRVEIFYDQPQTRTCVHSLFPHAGYTPCWYLDRSGIERIGLLTPQPQDSPLCDHRAGCAEPDAGGVLGAEAGTAMDRAPFLPTERTAKK